MGRQETMANKTIRLSAASCASEQNETISLNLLDI